MEITVLGSGAPPVPQGNRGGIGMALSIGDDTVLVDCGPLVVHQLMENEIDLTDIEEVYITHHHLDHTGSFAEFAILGWALGRQRLTVFGPDGTENLVAGLQTSYRDHIRSWREFGHPPSDGTGITDLSARQVPSDFTRETETWTVSAFPVEHNLETYAYRFDEHGTDHSFVYSGDTGPVPDLADFARDADVLIHDSNWIEAGTLLDEEDVPSKFMAAPYREGYYDVLAERLDADSQGAVSSQHSMPSEAGSIADRAGVSTLVLIHLNPYVDTAAVRQKAQAEFDGDVRVAQPGMTFGPADL
jgi:ribonuclease BN (tRNA processing enzyme)